MKTLIRFIVNFFLLAVDIIYDYRSYAQLYTLGSAAEGDK